MNSRITRKLFSFTVGVIAVIASAAWVHAAAYQDAVLALEPSYYYELNEPNPGIACLTPAACPIIVDTIGNAPEGSLNGDYTGGAADGGPEIGVPGPDFLLFDGAWTDAGWEPDLVGIQIPIIGLGEGNTAHFSNNSGHIDIGENDLFGAPAMSVAMFAKGGGNAQGGDRLFTNNLADPTRSFQIDVGNNGILVSFDPTQDNCHNPPLDNEDCAHRTLKYPGQGDDFGSGAGADPGLIGTDNGWWHIVATTEGDTALERAGNLRFYLNGVDRSEDMKAGTDGWGRNDFPAKIGGRRGDPTDTTTHSGWQDEVAIWLGKALTAEEALSLFDAAVNPPTDVPGDTNGDRKVDAADLNVVGINWQMNVDPGAENGDFDNSGFVDAADLNVLGTNWQFGVGDAAAAAVPEPASATCTFMSCLLALGLLRRKYGNK